MADILVKELQLSTWIDGDTLTVQVRADYHWIADKKFSATTFTKQSAEESIMFEFENFGLFIDGTGYKKAPEEQQQTPVPETNTSNEQEIKNYNKEVKNLESDLESTENINVENSEKVSKDAKKKMREKTNKNDEIATEAKPKFIIKIPKPFALGYWIIDLSKLFGKLLAALSAALLALVLAKLATLLADLFQKILDKGNKDIYQSDIDSALNGLDMNSIISESELELKNLKSYNSSLNPTDKDSGKVTDVYGKANKNKKNIANKNKYTIDRRNRKDILDSNVVKERNGSNNKNIKTVKNPNYGIYLD